MKKIIAHEREFRSRLNEREYSEFRTIFHDNMILDGTKWKDWVIENTLKFESEKVENKYWGKWKKRNDWAIQIQDL